MLDYCVDVITVTLNKVLFQLSLTAEEFNNMNIYENVVYNHTNILNHLQHLERS